MEFELTRSQKEIQKAVKEYIKGEFKREVIEELIEKHQFPEALWKKAADLGFIGIHYPETCSGQGLGLLENALVAETLCAGDATVGAALTLSGFSSGALLRFGTEEQKATWLPRVAEGEVLSCGAFTEPDCGYDLTARGTTAIKNGAHWVINGAKDFVVNAGPLAGFYIVLCRTGDDAKPESKGLTLILVESDRPGVSIRDIGPKTGFSLMHCADVDLSDVRVPIANTVGKENRGFFHASEIVGENRILLAAQAVGIAQGAYERTLAYVKSREMFGRTLSQFQVTEHKMADMAAKIEMTRLLAYKAASIYDAGRIDTKMCAIAKMCATKAAVEVSNEAIQLLGGYGYMKEYEVERFYLDAKMSEIMEGSQITQRDTIAGPIFGKKRRRG